MSTRYTIYGAAWCSFCQKAKSLLDDLSVPYTYVDIDVEDGLEDLIARLGEVPKTIPRVFYGDELIGGYDELSKHVVS